MSTISPEQSRGKSAELVFALIYPVGVDSEDVVNALSEVLSEVGYKTIPIHLIDFLKIGASVTNAAEKRNAQMDAGNKLRNDLAEKEKRFDAFALLAASLILKLRPPPESADGNDKAESRYAYVVRSLKRPEEVNTLRAIYGNSLIVVAAYATPSVRLDRLTHEIAMSDWSGGQGEANSRAQQLIERDESEARVPYGQRLREAFPLADVFVDASNSGKTREGLRRFIHLLFGYQFTTPSADEYAMFVARGTAYRSSDLSRQVGCVITSNSGQILSVGYNEVPKYGGGVYTEEDSENHRDFLEGDDSSTQFKRRALGQILERLRNGGWLKDSSELSVELIDRASTEVDGTDLMNVGEFGRAVHAEMSAIVSAARQGISVDKAVLYTTTFPCHVCARHIVAAGIERVVYVEPYPKSLVGDLHQDSIVVDNPNGASKHVLFIQFIGIAPRPFMRLFGMESKDWRKTQAGKIVPWNPMIANPRLYESPAIYLIEEQHSFDILRKLGEDYF
ncbi:MAG: tRNA-specific adenosine deaminase [Nitrospira sp.]|nr:tRNA-specific adenosine deaminase [Nitrospira sp.]